MSVEYKKREYVLKLSEEAYAHIILMRKPLNAKDDGHVILKALALIELFIKAESEGKHLAIVDNNSMCGQRVVL